MGLPCMPVRPSCIVAGAEFHGALGTSIFPPPPVPGVPSDMSLWLSLSPTYYGWPGEKPVENVLVCGEPAVTKGADTRMFRPHVVIVGIVPPTVVVGPIIDLGFFLFVIAVGATKPIWGPTTVKVGDEGGKSIAVMGIPYIPVNPYNQLICSDPCDLPMGLGIQMPSSVFAGMSLVDYLLCMVSIAADMLISFLTNWLFGGIHFLGTFFGPRVFGALARKLGPRLARYIGQGLAPGFSKIAEAVEGKAGKQAGELVAKFCEEALKKVASFGTGKLLPIDSLLGFGAEPPVWAG